jgi:tetratricopeptide (TPR) repeat protein
LANDERIREQANIHAACLSMKAEGEPPRPVIGESATKLGVRESYSMWLKRILDVHVAQSWDAESTAVHEREEEELNDVWTEIDDQQKERLWGLSSDLNSLRDRETWVESDWPPMTKEELARAQAGAFDRKRWDEFLQQLRRPPRFLPRNIVDYLRGRAWMEMGHPEVALLFFDNAKRLEPRNTNYCVLALECLRAMQDWPEVLNRCEACVRDSAASARLLFRVADALHAHALQSGQGSYYHEALRAVDEGFARLGASEAELASALAGAYATKALCLKHLGRADESLRVLDEAVQRFPENTTLLIARGLLKQQLGLPDAGHDFRRALERGTTIVGPYVELARQALLSGQDQESVQLCRRGLAFARSDTSRAILSELLAIALHRLNDSGDAIRAAFLAASELDPLNEEIRINAQRFESLAADTEPGEPAWRLDPVPPPAAFDEVYAQLQPAV